MTSDVLGGFQVLFVGHVFPDSLESQMTDQPISPMQTQRFGKCPIECLGDWLQW